VCLTSAAELVTGPNHETSVVVVGVSHTSSATISISDVAALGAVEKDAVLTYTCLNNYYVAGVYSTDLSTKSFTRTCQALNDWSTSGECKRELHAVLERSTPTQSSRAT